MRDQAIVSRRAIASALPFLALAAPAVALPAPSSDPIFAQIELHKALRIRANSVPGGWGDPTYDAEEEAAIQALGDMPPATLAGAAAQLAYMAEVEAAFADDQSPLLRTVLTVARALAAKAAA